MSSRFFNPFSRLSEIEQFLHDLVVYAPQKISTFPPCNVLSSKDGNSAKVQLAVAGYELGDIKIELVDGRLIISGSNEKDFPEEWEIVHNGVSAKDFELKFNVNRSFDVKGATLENGILEISLERVEGSKKSIEITPK
jgi:molecular chaperone IbpA